MEIYITAQLWAFLSSVLLGGAGALIYDLLRALRTLHRKSRALTHLLDGIYMLTLALALGWFALRVGKGELRLYMALGIFLGGWLYFALLSALLRPMWDFWAAALAQTVRLLLLPLRWMGLTGKKLVKSCKKSFYFHRKYATISKYKWEFIHPQTPSRGKRRRADDEKGQTKPQKKKKHAARASAGGADRRRGD